MTDDIMFGAVDVAADTSDEIDEMSVLEAGIRETKRLNERLVRISLPEKIAWELVMRVPNRGGYIANLKADAKKFARIFDVGEGTAASAMVLARYTVGILHGGDYAIDARKERAAAFADSRILKRFGARDSVEAVLKMFDSEPVVVGLSDRFMDELSMDDAEVETVEDPSGRG
jgi:hypothetical protein